MKRFASVLFGFALLAGCSDKNNQASQAGSSTNASSSESLATAPVDYLKTAVKAQQDAVKTVDTTSLNKAIDLFNVDKGRYPKDLDELVKEKYVPQIPATPFGTKLSYDSSSGKVQVVKAN